jgi:biotin carboxyl carrier protein
VFDVTVRGNNHLVTVIDPRRLRTDEDADRHHHGTAEITAPMPGKVVRVLVEAGEEVEAGAGLVVVEAMKMQNEMKSPRAGAVVSIKVAAGDTVEAGTLLAVIE